MSCAGLMQTNVPASEHRLVSLALMETFVRYSKCAARLPL